MPHRTGRTPPVNEVEFANGRSGLAQFLRSPLKRSGAQLFNTPLNFWRFTPGENRYKLAPSVGSILPFAKFFFSLESRALFTIHQPSLALAIVPQPSWPFRLPGKTKYNN